MGDRGVLPTFLGVSSIGLSDIIITLAGFMVLYTVLAVIEIKLMVKYIRRGPEAEAGEGGGQVLPLPDDRPASRPAALPEEAR